MSGQFQQLVCDILGEMTSSGRRQAGNGNPDAEHPHVARRREFNFAATSPVCLRFRREPMFEDRHIAVRDLREYGRVGAEPLGW